MDTFVDTKMLKRVDPIWKRLRVDRLWAILFIVYTVFYLGYAVWARYFGSSKDAGLLWIYLFNLLWWGNNAIGHVKNEKYWQRIGQRRQEAMSDTQPFLATSQLPKEVNDLTLPLILRLRWHRSIVIAIGALALIPILLLAIFGILALRQHNQTSDVLSLLAVLAVSFIILGLILYMTYFRGMPSLIEINETGIRTRYIQQERFLRWDEVRIFASYGAQGTKKNGFVTTYEVSNEHTVVRWSQQMLANPLLKDTDF